MQATLNIVTNPFNPNLDRVQKIIGRKSKINTLVHKYKVNLNVPVICVVNDTPVLRKDWGRRVIKDGEVVSFITLPQGGGGGGSNPLRLVLTIALMYYAPMVANSIGGPGSVLGGANGLGSFGMFALKAGISFLGSALINALVPPPSPPKSRQQEQMAAPSPTYSIGAQGNQARIGQAIPVLYGKVKVYPDFAAQPYAEFENNDQYLYQLFVVTQGKATILSDEVFIEDSPISSFTSEDYDIEILQPGEKSTIFPNAVYNVGEINGQELGETVGNQSLGPFPINPAFTTINKLSVDIVLSRGLYYANDQGGLSNHSVKVKFYATKIDDAGVNVGAEFQLGTEVTITAATQTVIRRTYSFPVSSGRYSVRVVRSDTKNTSARYANDVNLGGMRGYATEEIDYGNVTMIALKLKATNTFSQQSSRKINCIAQRQLSIPTYNAATQSYDWSLPTATSSIAWAIADMTLADYGAGTPESRLNLQQLTALNTIWQSRGDELNGLYDSTQTFWEAVTLACRAGRARPFIQGGMINFVRDGYQTLPTALFTSRNMVKDTFNVTFIMNTDDSADCVDIEYYDRDMWKARVVRAKLDETVVPKTPAKVKSFGITSRDQAYREGMNSLAASRYRREEISFETELEGHIPSVGDLIGVQNDIPDWGQTGETVEYTGGVITVDEDLKWTDGASHFVMFSKRDGSVSNRYEVQKGTANNNFTIVGSAPELETIINTDMSSLRTRFTFGPTGNEVMYAKVLSLTPRGDTVQISAINEDVRVHLADGSPVPTDALEYGIPAPKAKPVLRDFIVTQTGSGNSPSLVASWEPAAGARSYIIEKSTDNFNWETLGEITSTSFSLVAPVGQVWIRVAAMGALLGPYITKEITVGEVPPPPSVTVGSVTSNGQSFNIKWTEVLGANEYQVDIYQSGSLKRSFRTVTTNYMYSLENAIADGGPWRSITFSIRSKSGNLLSPLPLILNATNPSPAAPAVSVNPGNESVAISVSPCPDLDYAGTLIHAGDTADFTPSAANRIYNGTGNFFLHTGITTAKFYKAAHYDTYGTVGLNYSNGVSATPVVSVGGIEVVSALPTSGNFEGRVVYLTATYSVGGTTYEGDKLYTYDDDADVWNTGGNGGLPGTGQVTNDMLAGNITGNKINVANLAAINANTGNLTAQQITVDNSGHIKGGMTGYNVGAGFWMGYASQKYKFAIGNGTKGITWDGDNLNISGNLNGATGTFSGDLASAKGIFAGSLNVASALTGARLIIAGDQIKVLDANGITRVVIGRID